MPAEDPHPKEPARPGGPSRLPSAVFVGGLCAWAVTDRDLAPLAGVALTLWALLCLRGLPEGRRARAVMAVAGALLALGALAFRVAYGPELAPLREAPKESLLAQATLSIVLEGVGLVLGQVPRTGPAIVVAAAGLWLLVGQPRHRALLSLCFAGAAALGWRQVPYTLHGPEGVLVQLGYTPAPPPSVAALLREVPLPTPGEVAPTVQRVGLVMLESAALGPVMQDLAARPDSAFARVVARGRFYTDVIAPANASHIGQPALLGGHDYSPGVGWSPDYRRVPRPAWSFPAYFRALGWRTVMASSQDETWGGMDRLTLGLPWDEARHALDEPDDALAYRDYNNLRKLHDDGTRRRADTILSGSSGPLFLYVVFEDTHFAYVLPGEDEPPPYAVGLFLRMPPEAFPEAEARYRAALSAALDRAAALVEAHPDVLWVLAGDHGESLEVGYGFGHAKWARVEEAATFALMVGPGVSPGRDGALRSTLDLLPMVVERVTPGLLAGERALALDGSADAPGITFVYSHGLREFEVAAVDETLQLRVGANGVRCTARDGLPEPDPRRCGAARAALDTWLQCKLATGRGVGPAPDACFRAGRAAWRPPREGEVLQASPPP